MATVRAIDQHMNPGAEEAQLRQDLAAAYRLAALFGWDDAISTHFSVRLPGADHHFLINNFGSLFEEQTPSSLITIDLEGNVLDGPPGARVNKAGFLIHAGIHAAREDARCVLHCHTVAGVAVGAQEAGLLPISGHAMILHGRIGYHGYEGVTIDQDEAPRIVQDLGDNVGMMLRNHGTLIVGSTIAEAFFLLFHLEKACQIQVAAGSGPLVIPDPSLAQHMQAQLAGAFGGIADQFWSAVKRKLPLHDV